MFWGTTWFGKKLDGRSKLKKKKLKEENFKAEIKNRPKCIYILKFFPYNSLKFHICIKIEKKKSRESVTNPNLGIFMHFGP